MIAKLVRIMGLAGLLSITGIFSATSAFAASMPATASANTHSMNVIAQGSGYSVTAVPARAPKPRHPAAPGLTTPDNLVTESGTYNSTQSWTSDGTRDYNGSYMETQQSLTLSDAHKALPWQPDYLTANGDINAYWWGANPYDANGITIQPSENVTATQAVVGVSIPAGASVSTSSNTMYFSWPQTTALNTWQASYSWGKWEVKSSGTITNAQSNAAAAFQFGSATYACSNTISVNY